MPVGLLTVKARLLCGAVVTAPISRTIRRITNWYTQLWLEILPNCLGVIKKIWFLGARKGTPFSSHGLPERQRYASEYTGARAVGFSFGRWTGFQYTNTHLQGKLEWKFHLCLTRPIDDSTRNCCLIMLGSAVMSQVKQRGVHQPKAHHLLNNTGLGLYWPGRG